MVSTWMLESTSVYNELPDVMDADRTLRDRGKDALLMSFGDLFLRHRVEDYLGLRLLHKHNSLGMDELMLEREERDVDGTPCLTTIAAPLEDEATRSPANSWAVIGGRAVPLEFSNDRRVAIGLTGRERFLEEFDELARLLNTDRLLGICVLQRDFYDKHRSGRGGEILIEETEPDRRANVLRFADEGRYPGAKLIHASWAFRQLSEAEIIAGCATYCEAGSCVPHTACVSSNDAHEPVEHHSQGNHSGGHTGGQTKVCG